ncbi:MAG: RsmE family RNA methyltransferase [Polyangiaceae bacterium]
MTSLLLRVPIAFLQSGECTLSPDTSKYVLRVHRLVVGDRFVAFDPEQKKEAEAEVVRADRLAEIRVGPLRVASQLPTRNVTVIQALAKGSKVDAIVRDATELGATRIFVVVAERSVKREVSDAQRNRWRRIAIEAARQCGRGDVPRIDVGGSLTEVLPGVVPEGGVALCLHPRAEMSVSEGLAQLSPDGSMAMLIGPEGGLVDRELDAAVANGFVMAKLGGFVLRAETVCAAVLGAVAAR